jgi:hypothetical protein
MERNKYDQVKCNICNKDDFLRIHQIGVVNCVKADNKLGPEATYDILICKACGNQQVDIETIEIKEEINVWKAKY